MKNFFWGANLHIAARKEAEAGRTLRGYGFAFGNVFIGILVSKVEKK